MSGIRAALIAALADGAVHSGTDLAQRLACSRTAIWKHLNELKAVGLQIDARPGIGYQLAQRLELLDRDVILRGLSMQSSAALGCLELHDVIESTSERLRELPSPSPGRFDAVLAEYQLGGRGRRGRQWLSPFGSGLCLSVNRCFENTPDALSALSLAVGVGVCRVLRDDMTTQIGLKWPNDIVAGNSKLGGLLIDVQGEADGPIAVIVGIGLNFDVSGSMTEQVASTGGLPPIGLRELVREVDPSGPDVSRNDLAARLINAMYTVLTEFEQHGFAPFVDEWCRYDWLANRSVVAQIGQRSITGTARGIAKDGALLIDVNGELQRLVSGEVSLRPGCEGKL